ncbi:MAG: acyl carrier protein [Lachnospiraceae bacterium]|nr:acyl carrier protein [Lachnospiraceae bacterium]
MEQLLEILEELHPEVDFESCETLIDDKILDSFDIISIISEVNDVFDVTISAEYIIPDNFNSAKALYALIEKLEDEE